MYKVTSAKLTANPDEKGWSQVHDFLPEDKEKIEKRGHLYAVMATSKPPQGVDSVLAGRELLLRLHEEYFGKEEGGVFETLKNSVDKVAKEFKSDSTVVELGVTVLVEGTAYCAAAGGVQVALYRDGELVKILVGNSGVETVSGRVKDGDVLVLGTGEFFKRTGEGSIKAAMQQKDPGRAVEQLAPNIHSKKEGGNVGCVFISIGLEKQEELKIGDGIGAREETAGVERSGRLVKTTKGGFEKPRKIGFGFPALKISKKGVKVGTGFEDSEKVRQRKKVLISVGVILVFLLIVSVGFGIRQKKRIDFKESYESDLIQAKHEYEESLTLLSLNPERSRELFVSSKEKVERLQNEGIDDPALSSLLDDILSSQGKILGEYKKDALLYVDLSLLASGFVGSRFVSYGDTIYILDTQSRRVVSVELDNKRSEVVVGPASIDAADDITAYANDIFILNTNGIYKVTDGRKKVIDTGWDGKVYIHAYTGNLYLLESESSMIWRYSADRGGFGNKKEWFSKDLNVDISDVLDWSIDGAVWVLLGDGDISKFELGVQQTFSVEGVFPKMNTANKLFTSEDSEFLYILDKGNKRVVVLTKDGQYEAQYISDAISDTQDFVVSERQKKIILLTGEKLLSLDVEHI